MILTAFQGVAFKIDGTNGMYA